MYTRFSNFSTTYIQISWFKITCVLAFAKQINIGVTKISQAKNNDEIFRHIEISRMQIKIEKKSGILKLNISYFETDDLFRITRKNSLYQWFLISLLETYFNESKFYFLKFFINISFIHCII